MRRGDERRMHGAAVVEFALVLPLLMLLVMGTLDWGYYFFVDQVVTNAAREGARAGTLHDTDAAAAVADATATATNYAQAAGLTPAKLAVQVDLTTVATGASAIRVRTTYQAGSITGFLRAIVPATAQATATMRR
jgi:Flp pilus assembly protein TadG